MTEDERRAIEWECTRLINLYANLNDEARWEEAAALYAEDGLMTRPTAPDAPVVGREDLLSAFQLRKSAELLPRNTRNEMRNYTVAPRA